MNWSRGFKRIWYFLLGAIWLFVLFLMGMEGPAQLGQAVVYLLLFTIGWQLLGAAILWVCRGFKREA